MTRSWRLNAVCKALASEGRAADPLTTVYATKHRGPCWPSPQYLQALADVFFQEATSRLSALLEGVEAQRQRQPINDATPAARR